jgi:hypothetical protein
MLALPGVLRRSKEQAGVALGNWKTGLAAKFGNNNATIFTACDTLFSPASANPRASDTFATLIRCKLAMCNFGTITYGLIVPIRVAK